MGTNVLPDYGDDYGDPLYEPEQLSIAERLAVGQSTQCILCGCSNDQPCAGGCCWVLPNVCSVCVIAAMVQTGLSQRPRDRHRLVEDLVRGAECIRDYVGVAGGVDELPRIWRPGDPLPEAAQ
jgi:hypothetical protein